MKQISFFAADSEMSQCISKKVNEGCDQDQAIAICYREIQSKANAKVSTFEMYDEVGEDITVDGVKNFLNANKNNDISFDISTLGGDLATGLLIHDLIKSHPKKTIANITGLTASAGTIIALGCDEINISDNALFLVHNGWQEVVGNTYDMQKAASDLAKMDAIMIKIYREKTGLKDEEIKNIMKASDWMSPEEALNYGFVDKIKKTGVKIAASLYISEAKGKINNILLTKLEEKMIKNPFKSPKANASVLNILALKDGKNLLINAEEAAIGVEIAPLGAATLEDGEFELADGRKIVVSGGVITEVKEMTPPEGEVAASTEEIVAAVSALITPVMAKVEALEKTLAGMTSTHKPTKGTQVTSPSASVQRPVQTKIQEITDGIFQKIQETRKA
jgi:ATP-dependent protease ClpP protease subunit